MQSFLVSVQQMSQPDNGSERASYSNSQPKKNPGASWKADVNLAELKKLKWKGRHMDGHNDTVFCIDSDGEYAITGRYNFLGQRSYSYCFDWF